MTFTSADKVAHFGLFFVGAFILAAAMRRSFHWSPWIIIICVTVLMSALGAVDEWHQLHTPGRSGGDLGDWIADSLGGIGGAIALYAWHGFVRLIVRPRPTPIAPAAD
ncbi:MAG: VanZ family protein [Chthoniobacterales bacterium]